MVGIKLVMLEVVQALAMMVITLTLVMMLYIPILQVGQPVVLLPLEVVEVMATQQIW